MGVGEAGKKNRHESDPEKLKEAKARSEALLLESEFMSARLRRHHGLGFGRLD